MKKGVKTGLLRALRIGVLVGLLFNIVIWAASQLGWLQTELPLGWPFDVFATWMFRIAVVSAVIWSIIWLRQHLKRVPTFKESFMVGAAASLIFCLFAMANTLVHREVLDPGFNERTEQANRAYREKENELRAADDARKASPEALEAYLDSQSYFFTTQGALIIDLGAGLIWGLLTTATVAFFIRSFKPAER